MAIYLYNTLSRKKEEFKPLNKDLVSIYTCGPTVYNFAHIGNLRSYIFADLLKRVFFYNNFDVKHVMNITDVGHLTSDQDTGEDKMLKGAKREGKTVWEIAEFYTRAFMDDEKNLNIISPDTICKATDHIKEMIEMIKTLEKKGFTYISEGNVYYDVSKFKTYGDLARIDLSQLQAGARIDVDSAKKNPFDFVLWFTKSKFQDQEMKWPSPWGVGYPGWHIECSAMSSKYLGNTFDIHTGGIDHIPIHHTNEIAQSEAASGQKFVNYWMHGEFLVLSELKMSKSGEGFIILKTLIDKGYDPLHYRYFCLNAHYRQQLKFSWEGLDGAKNGFNNLKNKILELKNNLEDERDSDKMEKFIDEFMVEVNDDLNMPKALAVLWKVLKDDSLNNTEKYELALDFDKVLGLNLAALKKEELTDDIQAIVNQREEARKNKNFKLADELRDKLKSMGIILEDSKDGIKWRRV